MELRASIEALNALKESCEIEFFTDSTYVKNGVTKWLSTWKANGWRTKAKQAVKNADLWKELDAASSRHEIVWEWVKGHSGHDGNERCDVLATQAIEAIKKSLGPDRLEAALTEFTSSQNEAPAQTELL